MFTPLEDEKTEGCYMGNQQGDMTAPDSRDQLYVNPTPSSFFVSFHIFNMNNRDCLCNSLVCENDILHVSVKEWWIGGVNCADNRSTVWIWTCNQTSQAPPPLRHQGCIRVSGPL